MYVIFGIIYWLSVFLFQVYPDIPSSAGGDHGYPFGEPEHDSWRNLSPLHKKTADGLKGICRPVLPISEKKYSVIPVGANEEIPR